MKEKLQKKLTSVLSLLAIICMLAMMFVPNYVKSAKIVVSSMTNTGRGIGDTSVWTVNINGYSNLYCVRGGATIKTGTQLNDEGKSMYELSDDSVVKNSSGLQWILDNMYLTDATDANLKAAMKENLKSIMKKYNTYKDSNGNYILNKKLNGNGIDDNWINTCIDDVVADKTTLFAVQQYVIWNNVVNRSKNYNNTMQNSDGSYNKIPGAKANRVHYTALYITLNELAAEAQKNGYVSPNKLSKGINITLEKQESTKATISTDRKSALIGPLKLKNNYSSTKKFTAKINSEDANKVETVNADGKAVSVNETQGEFYVKVSYDKGFQKGVKYSIDINVVSSGIKTTATLLESSSEVMQPLVTVNKELYSTTSNAIVEEKEELKGDYSLILEKVDSTDGKKKVSGVTFKVKEGSGEEKAYGPTNESGTVGVVTSKPITAEGTDEYTITEVEVDEEQYISIKDAVTIYVTKSKTAEAYVASKVSLEKDKDVTSKNVKLKDNTEVVVSVGLSGNTVKVTIPNKPVEKPNDFDMALRKFISEVKRDGKAVDIGKSREPDINSLSASKYLNSKTAAYYHTKNPVTVRTGDTVVYTIRIYNEGFVDGYAKEITDYLPEGLEFVKAEESEINKANGWTVIDEKTVKTTKLSNTLIKAANGAEGFLSYAAGLGIGDKNLPEFAKDVQIECKVVAEVEDSKLLVNIAEITNYGYNDKDEKYVEANKQGIDIDSEENNVYSKNNDVKDIDSYYNKVVKPQNTENNNAKNDYKGMQDDDDFENVLVASTEKQFKFVLNKVDENDNPLVGADFTVQKTVEGTTDTLLNNEEVKGTYEVLENNVKYNTTYTYKVLEVESAPEYVNVMDGKYIIIKTFMNADKQLVLDRYKPKHYNAFSVEDEYYLKYGYTIHTPEGNLVDEKDTDLYGKIIVKVNNDVEPKQVTVKIPNPKEKKFDLALRKFITGVNETEVKSRVPVFKIDENGKYVYNHDKTPVLVNSEDEVTYTFRVYNEGEVNGYAKLVADDIPEGLEFLPENKLNKEQRWVMFKELPENAITIPEANIIKYNKKSYIETNNAKEAKLIVTDYLSKEQEKEAGANLIKAFNKESYDAGKIKEPDYKELKATFKVVAPNTSNVIIKNQAQIADDSDEEGNEVTDFDSTPSNWIEGEDDQDIEKIKLEYKKFDLALRKFITGVNDKEVKSRIPVFKIDEKGKYVYNHDKEPVTVGTENVVVYTIRVYNEGERSGYAEEVKDDIPNGLEFLPENSVNKQYRWIMFNKDGEETDDPKQAKYITTDYLSKEQEKEEGKNLLQAFDKKAYESGKIKEPDYRDVEVAFKVLIPDGSDEIVINHAEISDDSDEEGNPVNDEDSTPNKWIEGEDDQDIEKIKVQRFDLALRKFITGVNDKEVKSRIPVFKIDKDGKYVYNHDKEPVLVANTNVVIYTIRVYNEGQINGYAQVVRDDIPEGLEFLPEHKLNKEYRWIMTDKDDKETSEVTSAKYITTDYLSKEQEKENGANLLKAFNKEDYESGKVKEPDYRDVQVAFKVTVPDKSNEVIINHAQIAEDCDENGNDVTDIDSTPNVWNVGEDDQDIEKIKPQYFDLSLRKWVTKAIVTENGKETITETGHKAEDDPEAIVKVDLKNSDINNVKVKFEYKIRVTNEGQIPGYALEVRDDIPEGLEFVQEDNKDWKVVNGKVITESLKNTLLNPGESAEVTIVLTWKNAKNNMGLKTNIAEINKDYNEFGAPDIDSTPGNNVPGEDDIDDAPVMLTVKTGEEPVYVMLTISVLGIIAGGVIGIKKFVL